MNTKKSNAHPRETSRARHRRDRRGGKLQRGGGLMQQVVRGLPTAAVNDERREA